MEYIANGPLDRYISLDLSEDDARAISLQLATGLKIMHEESFAHRDLKPQNIFMVQRRPHLWIKIGDFGISKRVSNSGTVLRTSTGTPNYLAPEVSHYVDGEDEESDTYTNACDVWSFGCVIYEIMAAQVLFLKYPRDLIALCRGGPFPEAPLAKRISPEGIKFVKSILVPLPTNRPAFKNIVEAPWLHISLVRNQKKDSQNVEMNTKSHKDGQDGPAMVSHTKPFLPAHLSPIPLPLKDFEAGEFQFSSDGTAELSQRGNPDASLRKMEMTDVMNEGHPDSAADSKRQEQEQKGKTSHMRQKPHSYTSPTQNSGSALTSERSASATHDIPKSPSESSREHTGHWTWIAEHQTNVTKMEKQGEQSQHAITGNRELESNDIDSLTFLKSNANGTGLSYTSQFSTPRENKSLEYSPDVTRRADGSRAQSKQSVPEPLGRNGRSNPTHKEPNPEVNSYHTPLNERSTRADFAGTAAQKYTERQPLPVAGKSSMWRIVENLLNPPERTITKHSISR